MSRNQVSLKLECLSTVRFGFGCFHCRILMPINLQIGKPVFKFNFMHKYSHTEFTVVSKSSSIAGGLLILQLDLRNGQQFDCVVSGSLLLSLCLTPAV